MNQLHNCHNINTLIDQGTPELQRQKQLGLTTLVIDYLLDVHIINKDQHHGAELLRRLYSMRNGRADISAYDIGFLGGREHYVETSWHQEKSQEYKVVIIRLQSINALKLVINTCVYNQVPTFLSNPCVYSYNEFSKFKEGLDVVVKILVTGEIEVCYAG